ncbi:MAG: hypothetical protein JOY71_31545, partial [Acetobacteraceae bacterium]|nr:hypothetical protein [Acetobacteraceae bacterium]
MAVVARHVLPGRVRLHVPGLRRSFPVLSLLQGGLRAFPGVQAVSGSTLTGNVLVLHDPSLTVSGIVTRIEALLRGDIIPVAAEGVSISQDWHTQSPSSLFQSLGTSASRGLSTGAARKRLAEYGPNLLPRPARRSALAILASQFSSLAMALLTGASVLALLSGSLLEGTAILGVIGLNAAIGFVVESRAERILSSLGLGGDAYAPVLRDGAPAEVPVGELVPGDIMMLSRDDVVPADGRVIECQALSVNEGLLTGESLPVSKNADSLTDPALPLADRVNMVYRGTAVTGGSGRALVVATGPNTEMGRIQWMVSEA